MLLSILLLLILFIYIYFNRRNNKVYNFNREILITIHKLAPKEIKRANYEYQKIPYHKMLFSFKKLTFENYFSPNIARRLSYERTKANY